MEVVGGVASVVGIIGFTGQAISGLLKLRVLINDAVAAKDTIKIVLESINLLTTTLKEVDRVVRVIETDPKLQLDGPTTLQTGALKYQVMSCVKDVNKWVIAARKLDPQSRKGIKSFLRKIKVAAGKEDLQSLAQVIPSHQQRVGIAISLLGRTLDVFGIQRLDNIDKGLGGLTEAHLKLSNLINADQNGKNQSQQTETNVVALLISQLDSVTTASSNTSHASLQSIQDSISSLASDVANLVSTSLQDKEEVAGTTCLPIVCDETTPYWSCDSVPGIEDGFIEDLCVYCSSSFKIVSRWQERGQHLVDSHGFGKCNLAVTFSSWHGMKAHLMDFHEAKIKAYVMDSHDSGWISFRQITSLFMCPRRTQPLFQRTIEGTDQFLKQFHERSTAFLILKAQFWSCAADLEISDQMNHIHDTYVSNVRRVEDAIKLVTRGKLDSIVTPLWHIRRQLASAVDEMIIGGTEKNPYRTTSQTNSQTRTLVDVLPGMVEAVESEEFENAILPLFLS